jgi:hypothetical protein
MIWKKHAGIDPIAISHSTAPTSTSTKSTSNTKEQAINKQDNASSASTLTSSSTKNGGPGIHGSIIQDQDNRSDIFPKIPSSVKAFAFKRSASDNNDFKLGQELAMRHENQIQHTVKTKIFRHIKFIKSDAELCDLEKGSLAYIVMEANYVQQELRTGFWSVAKTTVSKQITECRQQMNTKVKKAWFSK